MGQVFTEETLLTWIAAQKAAGVSIVTTNGCFDLLHVGHLRYLQAARLAGNGQAGDPLIVALNSDASVRRLKGPTRPIIGQAERAELLAGLACVDGVVIFDEDTPIRVLEAIHPDVHVKGGQYTLETLPEAPALLAMDTKVVFIPMVEGRSTSELVERIQALPLISAG